MLPTLKLVLVQVPLMTVFADHALPPASFLFQMLPDGADSYLPANYERQVILLTTSWQIITKFIKALTSWMPSVVLCQGCAL